MVVDSAPLNLEQCHALVRATALAGRSVARVHTGDPSLYGALREQAALLDADGIPWRVVPALPPPVRLRLRRALPLPCRK